MGRPFTNVLNLSQSLTTQGIAQSQEECTLSSPEVLTVMRGYVARRAMMPPIAPEAPSMAALEAMTSFQKTKWPQFQLSAGHLRC